MRPESTFEDTFGEATRNVDARLAPQLAWRLSKCLGAMQERCTRIRPNVADCIGPACAGFTHWPYEFW